MTINTPVDARALTASEYAAAKKRLVANDSSRVDRRAREDAAAMARHQQLNTKKDPTK